MAALASVLSESFSAGGSRHWDVGPWLCSVSAATGSSRPASLESAWGMRVYVGTALNRMKPRVMTTKERMYSPENCGAQRRRHIQNPTQTRRVRTGSRTRRRMNTFQSPVEMAD